MFYAATQMVDRNVQCARYKGIIDIYPYLKPAHNNGNEYEKLQYFYHSDHLGSASFVTNAEGAVVQHLQYLPYGELFVSQRNTEEFDSRYKFTAKELDNETSYTYFGARYYDADLSSWLSVDPLSDKYPSLSPYIYSADNPVVLVDPNGKVIKLVGTLEMSIFQSLLKSFKGINGENMQAAFGIEQSMKYENVFYSHGFTKNDFRKITLM